MNLLKYNSFIYHLLYKYIHKMYLAFKYNKYIYYPKLYNIYRGSIEISCIYYYIYSIFMRLEELAVWFSNRKQSFSMVACLYHPGSIIWYFWAITALFGTFHLRAHVPLFDISYSFSLFFLLFPLVVLMCEVSFVRFTFWFIIFCLLLWLWMDA